MRTATAVLASVAFLASSLLAANAPVPAATPSPTAATMPAAPQVLKHIPADCYGFALINDVKGTAAGVDTFMNKIGVSGFVRDKLPNGLLAFVKQELNLGDDFTGEGPAAFVVLNFAVTGLTFDEASAHSQDKAPIAFVIPGKSVKSVLPKAEVSGEGEIVYFNIEGQKALAIEKNGLIFVALNEASLRAVVDCANSIASEMTKEQLELVSANNASAYLNVKAARAPLAELWEKALDTQDNEDAPQHEFTSAFVNHLRKWIDGLDSFQAGARLTADNVTVETLLSVNPKGELVKELQSLKPAPMLDKLPAGPYVIAGASAMPLSYAFSYGLPSPRESTNKALVAMIDALGQTPDWPLTEETTKSFGELFKMADKNYRNYQFAIYGPSDGRAFSAAVVVDCLNVKEVRQKFQDVLAAAKAELLDASVAISVSTEPVGDGIEKLSLKFTESEDKSIAEVTGKIKKMLGDDSLRVLLATPNDRTLVLTVGGGKDFMDQVLKAVKDGGELGKDAKIVSAVKQLPAKPTEFVLINGGNLVDTITKVIELSGGHPAPLAVTQTPLVSGTGVSGNTVHSVIIVPNLLIKQSVSSAMMLFMGAGGLGKTLK